MLLTFSVATDFERDRAREVICNWMETSSQRFDDLVDAVGGEPDNDRWFVRLKGEAKSFISIWFDMDQRSLFFESQFMPGPIVEENQCYSYLLRKNSTLNIVHFSLGLENAIYLVGSEPVVGVTELKLDEIVGAIYAYSEEFFPTAMSIGYKGSYKYKKSKNS